MEQRYVFDTFLKEEGNRAAYDICVAVAALRPVQRQPVVLLADKGSGKTHLLYSIVNRKRAQQKEMQATIDAHRGQIEELRRLIERGGTGPAKELEWEKRMATLSSELEQQRSEAAAANTALAYVRSGDFPVGVRALIKDPRPIERAANAILLVDNLESFVDELDELEAVVRIFLDNGHYVVLATSIHPGRLGHLPAGLRDVMKRGRVVPLAAGTLEGGTSGSEEDPVREETQATIDAQRRQIEELLGRIETGETAPDPKSDARLAALVSELAQQRAEATKDREELEHLRAENALYVQDHQDIVPIRLRLEEVQNELAEIKAGLGEGRGEIDRSALLQKELDAANAENVRAREEANSVLTRAEALLDAVQEGRMKFAESQQEHDAQLREIRELESVLARTQEPVEDGDLEDAPPRLLDELNAALELDRKTEAEPEELQEKFDRARDGLQSQIVALRNELEAVTAEREAARSHVELVRTGGQQAVADVTAQRDAALHDVTKLREELSAITQRHAELRGAASGGGTDRKLKAALASGQALEDRWMREKHELEEDLSRVRGAVERLDSERETLSNQLREQRHEVDNVRNEAAQQMAALTKRNGEMERELSNLCLEIDLILQSNRVVSTELQVWRARLADSGGPPVSEPVPIHAPHRPEPPGTGIETASPHYGLNAPGPSEPSSVVFFSESAAAEVEPHVHREAIPGAYFDESTPGDDGLESGTEGDNGPVLPAGETVSPRSDALEPLEPLGEPDLENRRPNADSLHHVEQLGDDRGLGRTDDSI